MANIPLGGTLAPNGTFPIVDGPVLPGLTTAFPAATLADGTLGRDPSTGDLRVAVAGVWTTPGGGDPNSVHGLAFNGANHVNFGGFWKSGQVLGNSMLWEAWVSAVSAIGGYWLSDGYGGAHALLWGPAGGNIWTGAGAVGYGYADETIPDGQIYHVAVGLGTNHINETLLVTYINGIPCSSIVFTGTRTAPTGGGGTLTLFMAGSDHSQFEGVLYMVRGYDLKHPGGANNVERAFTPERSFIDNNVGWSIDPADHTDFLVDYTKPARIINDLSQGYHGGDPAGPRIRHPGGLFATSPSPGYQYGRSIRPTTYPVPSWITPTSHPFGLISAPSAALPLRALTPAAVPAGAIVFDSFSREDQTFAYQSAPTLGSTEGGSAGVAAWVTALVGADISNCGYQWGILGGRACFLDGFGPRAIAYPNVNVPANMDVSYRRTAGGGQNGGCGLAFRIVDKDNFMYSEFLYNAVQGGIVAVYKVVAGVCTYLLQANTGKGTWIVYRVVADGTAITVYGDATLLLSVTDATHQTATKAGIYFPAAGFNQGNSSHTLNRYDDFLIKAAP